MGKVLASIQIFPKDADLDLDRLKAAVRDCLPEDVSVERYDSQPIAFGLVALVAHLILPEESEGKMDAVEEALRGSELVSEIQVLQVGRI